ncbi:hypothetical protein [Crocosphaera sp. Alani8]|uniref:hypothetical protein n=1 Tax=Crocosphaera sp. Alani8 TaxID=3038952 RepID=UPI00313D4FD7
MLSKKAKIYEFSRKFLEPKWSDTLNRYATTGFHKEIGWENKKVPKEIINAVDNHLLRINDNYPPSENDLALIARELQNYAILAIATRLMDDHYRPLVAYRYFWLKKPSKNDDIDGVGTLLKWWINQNNLCYQLRPSSEHKINKKTPSKLLVLKNDLKQNFYEGEILKEIETKINQSHINLFIDFENLINEYKYQQFHTLTLILSQKYNVPLSWAYNVNKLENPEQFTLIYHQGNLIVNRLNPSRKIFCEYSYSDENITNTNLKRCLMDIAKNKKIESNFLRLSNYLPEMLNVFRKLYISN